jgi:hypothetical protein
LSIFSYRSRQARARERREEAMSDKIRDEHLRRGAIVYIRQSTPTQLTENRESQRRQYALADRARELGFQRVDVIDEDLGRSGSGLVERPGLQRVVAAVCSETSARC